MRKISLAPILAIFTETFGLGRAVATTVIILISSIVLLAVFWFFHSAPPKTLTITSGPEGSVYQTNADRYRQILARNGVNLKILPSQGSLENLQRLADRSVRVDVGFVQGGVADGTNLAGLVSLGSISYQPLFVFCRSEKPIELLSDLNGKRLAIGPVGSGARSLALTLLITNNVELGAPTTLLALEPDAAATALVEGKADAVFLMGDSASTQIMRKLLRAPKIQLLDFTQADAYTRRIGYLNKLVLPKGSLDFGKNLPDHDVNLMGPTVDLVARANLHPALSDLLLEAAREVHGGASLLKRKGEFPAPLEHDFPISADATRYYKSGKTFLYRYLPFWQASLLNRLLVILLPLVVVIVPALRMIPLLYRLRMRLRLFRWYRALLALERELFAPLASAKREELLRRLDHIENAVNKMKVPASFADQFYGLRGDINFVRSRLVESPQR